MTRALAVLHPEERATLMRLLIETLGAESEEGVEDACRLEIERRMAELWGEFGASLYRR
jgi:hypothetical protein